MYAVDYPILWKKIDKSRLIEAVTLSNKNNLIIQDSRFELLQEFGSFTYTLRVLR